jgi:hypothetical protein
MTRQDLNNFRYLKKEIEMLDNEIKNLGYDTVSDTVRGSDREWPYTEHTITITGIDVEGHGVKAKRLQRRLERRKADLQDKRLEIAESIEAVDDSVTRQAIVLKYVNGLSWTQVAAHVGGGNTAEGLRKRVHRFFVEN